MAIGGGTLVSSIASTSNLTTYTFTAGTNPSGAANTLLISCFVATGDQIDPSSTPTGNGVTWSNQGTNQNRGSTIRSWIYAADGTGATGTAFSVTWAAAKSGCAGAVIELTGVDLSGGVGGAFVQVANEGTPASGTGLITLAAASHSDNRTCGYFEHGANETNTAGTNFTLASTTTNYNTPATSIGFEHGLTTQDMSVDMTWATTTGAHRGQAFEIKALVAGLTKTFNPVPFYPTPTMLR